MNVDVAYSESTYASAPLICRAIILLTRASGPTISSMKPRKTQHALLNGNIHSSDVFYRSNHDTPEIAVKNNCEAVEMEAFALFNAKQLNKMAATLLTISDVIPTKQFISADQRQNSPREDDGTGAGIGCSDSQQPVIFNHKVTKLLHKGHKKYAVCLVSFFVSLG